MMEKDTDFELVKDFLSGNESAFNRLIQKYQQKIYWHARRIVLDHYDADEITQEVILVLYKKLESFRFNSTLYTWIYRITSNRSLNHLRKKNLKRLISLDSSELSNLGKPEDIAGGLEDKEKIERLEGILEQIPPKQREVFALRHFEGLSYDEISKITNRSVGSIKANYFHAINKVLEMMEDEK